MSNTFCFVVQNTQGICFPWKCEAPDEREAYKKLWEEHKEELREAKRITEREANFRAYRIPAETVQLNPTH